MSELPGKRKIAQGWIDDGEELDIELPTEDSYLVLQGANTYVSRFINGGEPVKRGQTIFVTVTTAGLLLTTEVRNPKNNLRSTMFRMATDEERDAYLAERDTSNPRTASREAMSRKAREEQIDAGHASYDAEKVHAEEDALKSTRSPRRRRSKNQGD